MVEWVAELRVNISQHNQIIPSSVFEEESSWASRPEIRHTLPSVLTNLHHKLSSFFFEFFSQNLLLTTAVLPPFYHTISAAVKRHDSFNHYD